MELGAWGMAENPRTHHALLLAAGGSATRLDALIIGKPGYVMGGTCKIAFRPTRPFKACSTL